MASSRHTKLTGKLTRSLGVSEGRDLVVELDAGGLVRIREEPVDRRLRRGEVLPEVVIDVREAFDKGPGCAPEDWIERAAARLESKAAIADFGEEAGAKPAYAMKVWLTKALKELREDM